MYKLNAFICLFLILSFLVLLAGCEEEAPPRDEIPLIKDLIGNLESAVKGRNPARIDSLIIAEAYDLGYHSTKIMEDVFQGDTAFFAFGRKSFVYTEDKAKVECMIMADSTDAGRPLEMILVKVKKKWYLKRFDLK